jgi:bacterioferritin-associated ferredoxin
MVVCSCRAVTDRAVRAAVAGGATQLSDVIAMCSAGAGCGGCWPRLERVLAETVAVHETAAHQAA